MGDNNCVPIGASRTEGHDSELQAVDGNSDCPNCGEGVVGLTLNTRGRGYGFPSSPVSDCCRECGTSFTLALVPDE